MPRGSHPGAALNQVHHSHVDRDPSLNFITPYTFYNIVIEVLHLKLEFLESTGTGPRKTTNITIVILRILNRRHLIA